jgi:hypothetical protein
MRFRPLKVPGGRRQKGHPTLPDGKWVDAQTLGRNGSSRWRKSSAIGSRVQRVLGPAEQPQIGWPGGAPHFSLKNRGVLLWYSF